MDWTTSPPELVERFGEALPENPAIQRRLMFGYPSAVVGGHMFASLHGNALIVRLPEEARGELLAIDGARPFEPMPGRPMREYVVVPPAIVGDLPLLQTWVDRAFRSAAALPAKETTARKKKK